jgi:hypothetical protein
MQETLNLTHCIVKENQVNYWWQDWDEKTKINKDEAIIFLSQYFNYKFFPFNYLNEDVEFYEVKKESDKYFAIDSRNLIKFYKI